MFEATRKEYLDFYLNGDEQRAKALADKCFAIMDERYSEGMSVTEQKLLQYDVLTENCTPVLFPHSPFFSETSVLTSLSDGARGSKAYFYSHANAWVYNKNKHLFDEQDVELNKRRNSHLDEILYLICGPYNDTVQHFNFNTAPFLQMGGKGICQMAKAELANAKNEDEAEFLNSVCEGMGYLRRLAERFALLADDMLKTQTDPECIKNLKAISVAARRVPWEAPESFYEALATVAFLRTAVGTLEGAGLNTFGRLDRDLISFYNADIENGRLTREEAYELVSKFLLLWDCHYDHDMIMEGYADHELENTYTVGGCDEKGEPLCNELTLLFIKATRENGIIFPKIKCRFSKNSPKEYFDEINEAISVSNSAVLLQNDDATIPAVVRSGRSVEEARDYIITGCWGLSSFNERFDHGNYLNLLKPFEYALHGLYDKIEKVGIPFETFDKCESFEELYRRNLSNCEKLLEAKCDVMRRGGQIHHKVDRYPIFSSSLDDCVKNHADYTMGGTRYRDDYQLLFGFPNIVDSLIALKRLVFETGKYTLDQYLEAVRANWEGFEDMRLEAVACPGWGDGSEESCELARRFNEDLYGIFQKQTGIHGGKVHMGHLTYTEIRWWGEKTLSTPDGRRSGEYFAQGLTPSRLKRISNVNDVINSLASLDPSLMGANSVVNVMLPSGCPKDYLEGFLRTAAGTALQCLQLNCVSKKDLLDAQVHPEKYPNLVVRVTGFSAKFTSLSKGWQDEVITRNFYDR